MIEENKQGNTWIWSGDGSSVDQIALVAALATVSTRFYLSPAGWIPGATIAVLVAMYVYYTGGVFYQATSSI